MLALPPLDFQVHDTYFVVAHFHYVLFGGSVFAAFAAIHYWFPKFTGKQLDETWARITSGRCSSGSTSCFFPQHDLGLRGMQRRIATYPSSAGWSFLNMLSSIGAFILAFSVLPFLLNVWETLRKGKKVGPNPWDGMTLEWVTKSPPVDHNFDFIPPIRSERPVWDLNHPDHPTLPHGRRAREMAIAGSRRGEISAMVGGSAIGGPLTEGNGHGNGGSPGDGSGGHTPGDGGGTASGEVPDDEGRMVPRLCTAAFLGVTP